MIEELAAVKPAYVRQVAKQYLPVVQFDRDVLELARERIRQAIPQFDTVIVSFSGGKDSTVVLNLTIEAVKEMGRGKVRAMFIDEEAIPLETIAYVERVAATGDVDLDWYCLPVRHRNACSRKDPWWFCWDPDCPELWVREMPACGITWDKVKNFAIERDRRPTIPDMNGFLYDPIEYGRVGLLMGIRGDESLTRRRAVSRRSGAEPFSWIIHWNYGYRNLFKIYPIYDWRTPDVWLAPQIFGWDYNTTYDLMERAGISHHDQRCAPPFGEEPLQRLWQYATCFPDIWDKMQRRVPGAATAARYSRTQLYSFKSMPEKPADMSWQEFIRHQLAKHPEPYRSEIAARVQNWVQLHFEKTTDPLANTAPHPETGTSWRFLLDIAVRGDFKDRRQAGSKIISDRMESIVKHYQQEIAEMRTRGELP